MTYAAKAPDLPMRELLVFYYKYRTRLRLAFFLPIVLAVIISCLPTPLYQASSVLVVRLGSEYVYQPETGTSESGPPTTIPFERDQIYKSEVAILQSDDLHEAVIKAVGIEKLYPDLFKQPSALQQAIAPLMSQIKALLAQASEMAGGEPNRVLTPDEQAKAKMAAAVQIFDKKLDVLLEKESAVISVTFENKNRDVAIQALDTLLNLYLEKRRRLYIETRSDLAKDQADAAHRRAVSMEAAVERFKRENKIYSLDSQRAQLLQQRQDVMNQIQKLSSQILEDRLESINSQLDELDKLEREYNVLDHEKINASSEDSLYSRKFTEAQAFDNLEHERSGSVRVIGKPSAPLEPKKLQTLIIIVGVIFGLISVVVTAAMTEFFRSGFLTPERLERHVGLPVLAVFPNRK